MTIHTDDFAPAPAPARRVVSAAPTSPQEEAIERDGYCSGWDKLVRSTDHPCVLFLERGTWETRQIEKRIHEVQLPRDRKLAKV